MKIIAKIVLVNSNNEFLLLLRDNKPDICYRNYWNAVGGEIEPGETMVEGLKREIREEVSRKDGSECSVWDISYLSEIYISRLKSKVSYFKGRINERLDDILVLEGQRAEYFTFAEIMLLKKLPAPYKKIVLQFKEELVIPN